MNGNVGWVSVGLLLVAWGPPAPVPSVASPAGEWKAALDLAGGELRFSINLTASGPALEGTLCNGRACQPFSAVRADGDSVVLELADYAATIGAALRRDSLVGAYRNVGNRGPRAIPFRAARGRWEAGAAPARWLGKWDATYYGDWGTSPRVFDLRNGTAGL